MDYCLIQGQGVLRLHPCIQAVDEQLRSTPGKLDRQAQAYAQHAYAPKHGTCPNLLGPFVSSPCKARSLQHGIHTMHPGRQLLAACEHAVWAWGLLRCKSAYCKYNSFSHIEQLSRCLPGHTFLTAGPVEELLEEKLAAAGPLLTQAVSRPPWHPQWHPRVVPQAAESRLRV